MKSLLVAASAALVLATGASSAPDTYPGKNGLIAYTKQGPPCIARQCGESLWVSALDGSNAKQLTPPPRIKDQQRRFATWSPDGTTIAYVDNTGPRSFGSAPQELWIIKANGTGRKKVVPFKAFQTYKSYNNRLSWTADGKELAFLLPESGSVLAVDVRTRKVRQLMRLPRGTEVMQLSPNGKLIAFSRFGLGLFVRRLNGGTTTRIAKADTSGFTNLFAWSPDSARLVFLTAFQPSIVSAGGGPVRRLVIDHPDPDEQWNGNERPIWSPDGKTILWQVLSHAEENIDPYARTVYDWDRFRTIDVDSGKVTVVGPGTGSCRLPAGGTEDTGGRRGPDPCPVSNPSWQPRK